ncbi:Vegetative incompatibility protein HET-E-1 [Fusarium oxysporum f. sp. cepae]|nr:Vegetative incompatibility protein HET-E-1 [Fusarium oxysporum f. sp. cepae]
MRTKLKSPDLYAIGWIAALPIERAAATALLHDRHDAPEGFDQHLSDTNSYTWGRIGEHNVVIASLPAGVYGTISAATTASNLIHSLPHIRIGLLPDGTTGGVVQYDLGKAKADSSWERKGSLDKPPPVLLHALASIQAEHEIEPSKVSGLLQAMLEAKPSMKRPNSDYTYQGAENDRLFEPQHDHVGGSNCDKCDPAWQVKRKQRESPEPEIHYGIIASGNKLIKDAATRDSLLGDTGHQCLCVEMEAAGLMDQFPCLVIRGICDYADSHKNDRWQRYAAATAAAFGVELLEYVPAAQLEATQKVVEAIQSRRTPIHNIDYRTAFDQLPIAEGASFDSKAEEHNPTCLHNTRQELLEDIDSWIDGPSSKTIYWLNGMAGTGKSTISRTVAHSRSKRGDLGASFFFKRGEMDRGNLNKLMSTLAYQLASSIPGVAFLIKKTLDTNPAVVGKSVIEQFQKLIQEPLSEAAASTIAMLPVVMVIDALDECDQEDDIRLLINIFSQAKTVLPQLRVFLTSRPELPIRLGFSEAQGSYRDLVLHEIPAETIKHDIVVFMNDEFQKVRYDFNMTVGDERKLPADWPGRPTVKRLAQMAVPLFVFAATVCRFVGDSRRRDPRTRLQTVLDQGRKSHGKQLEQTYLPVLLSQIAELPREERQEVIDDFKVIVGSIVTLASPLSVTTLSRLIDVLPDVVDERLDGLHSVLSIPLERKIPVRMLHLSFRDYLVDPRNRERIEFWIDEKVTHQRLAKQCLRVMRGALRENICGLSFLGMHRSAVGVRQIEERVPAELQYACMYWVHHQTRVELEPNDKDDIYNFLETHFLHWLEALSLLGRISESIGFIDELQSIVGVEEGRRVLNFLHDAKRFVLNYRAIIDTAPLQLYTSAIVFAPKQSIMRKTFERYLPRWFSLLPKVDSNWNAVLQTLEGHTDSVRSVVFSNNGKLIASGSVDTTVKIWNVATGEEERTLKGHTGWISSVAFSNDGKLIASGSNDTTVKIWNMATGEEERTLKGHRYSVSSVAFSNDGKLIASGSDDTTVKIWNVATGEEERTLKGHRYWVSSVAFSNDGKLIASGSDDPTVKIWNMATGEEERTLKGHAKLVSSVVFSKDGKLIASGSVDKTVKIWNMATGTNVKSFDASEFTDVLSFTDNDSVLVTNTGRFSLGFRDTGTSQSTESETKLGNTEAQGEVDGRLGFGMNRDSTWITAGGPDGRKVLWLPPDFRPGVSATLTGPSGSVLVIGCLSGRVIIMGFRALSSSDEV